MCAVNIYHKIDLKRYMPVMLGGIKYHQIHTVHVITNLLSYRRQIQFPLAMNKNDIP